MTPASSVLLLTTLTGFGYGLLAWVGILATFGLLPGAPLFIPAVVLVALAFANAGLIAKELGVTPRAAQNLVAELGLREATGRGRYRAWGIL